MISCVFTEERIEFAHTAIKPRSVDCCSDVCPSVGFSYLHLSTWSSTRMTIRFLITSLDKALLHQFELSLAGRPPLGRVLVVANIFHLRIMETTVLLGKVQKSCLDTIQFLSSAGRSFDFTAWVFTLICFVSCEAFYREVCTFPNHVQVQIMTPIKV